MTMNESSVPSRSVLPIDTHAAADEPSLSVPAIIECSGVGNLLVLLRARMGFPVETFSLAVRPLIEGYAGWVQLRAVPGSRRYGVPGGELQRALATALRALDQRRGEILPRHAPPETLGALAHRWTYGVFAAALLRDTFRERPDDALPLFERWVPPMVSTWLGEDTVLMAELQALFSGSAAPSNAIAELVERAVTGVRPASRASASPAAAAAVPVTAVELNVSPAHPAGDGAARLDCMSASGSEPARRFLAWLREGIAAGTLAVNARGALVHGVEEGLLLVSPGIFRAFVRCEGAGPDELRAAARSVQRELLRAGWHLRGAGGVNLQGYRWQQDGRTVTQLHGIVLLAPQRFLHPVPALNRALLRVDSAAVAPE